MDQDLLKCRTLAELERIGYRTVPVRIEIRNSLLRRLRNRENVLPGIIGYDDTVLPEIENAVLAGHHMILLGERGQAKSRVIRALTGLLDEHVPAVEGCDINDDPFNPICARCRRLVAERSGATPIVWIGREHRYAEKLATPDVSVADLIGEIDPIKVAEGRYLADQETIHYGLIPRVNRGLFAINELPDLTEKVQVGLFNLMEEKDVQIKGYKIRLPVDVIFVASANPSAVPATAKRGVLQFRSGAQSRAAALRTSDAAMTSFNCMPAWTMTTGASRKAAAPMSAVCAPAPSRRPAA